MERGNQAKKPNKFVALLLIAALIGCALPSVSYAEEIAASVTPVLSAAPDPASQPTPLPTSTPFPKVKNTPSPSPLPTPSASASPDASLSPDFVLMADKTLPPEPESQLEYVIVETNNRWVLPNNNNNKHVQIQVFINNIIVEFEDRYYEQNETGAAFISLTELSPYFVIDRMEVFFKGEATPFNNGDSINLNASDTFYLRIYLGSAITLTGADTCAFRGQSVDLTGQVTATAGFAGITKFYNTSGTEIAAPQAYPAESTQLITARAFDAFGHLLAETAFTVYVIDPALAPAEQSILLGETAVISVIPDPLLCDLHSGAGFSFEWSVNGVTADPDSAGMPLAPDQSALTVTPSKAGTYYYDVTIRHDRGTDGTIETTLTAAVEVSEGMLTLTHNGHNSALDPNQSFVFKIVRSGFNGSNTETFYEVIQGNGSRIIKGLGYGAYTVTAVSGWSWRYVPDTTQIIVELDSEQHSGNAVFNSSRTFLYWLSGEAFGINQNPSGY